ncbi:MAG: DUF3696 domain-containing protein [Saprospiraceae bacterium]
MIEKITFQNYKLFREEQELELRPLTILIGKNSSGKSAITKLLPLIENSISGELDMNEPLLLNNNGVEVGSEFRDLVYGRHEVGALEFELYQNQDYLYVQIASGTRINDIPKITQWKLSDTGKEIINYQYNDRTKQYLDLYRGLNAKPIFNGINLSTSDSSNLKTYPLNNSTLSNRGFKLTTNYIGPYRFVPPPIIDFKNIKNGKMGIEGTNAYSYLVKDALHNNGKILNQLSDWYSENFEGWGLNIKLDNRPHYELELIRKNPNFSINFSQVGQGMIQSLPMVLSSFIPSSHNDLINIFEQPELHLHPAAHGNLAERFANSTIGTNKRYLIETHSQNFVLRLRRLVAEGKLNKDKLRIYYVNFDEEKGESKLEEIKVYENGKVDSWPSNIFSETLIETEAIHSAQMQNPYK